MEKKEKRWSECYGKEINEIPAKAQRAVSTISHPATAATKVLSGDNVPAVVTALSVLPSRLFPYYPSEQHIGIFLRACEAMRVYKSILSSSFSWEHLLNTSI